MRTSRHLARLAAWCLLACVPVFAGQVSTVAAWSRECAWPPGGGGITTIPVDVHCASYESLGYDCDEVLAAIRLASRPWNEQGGTAVRLGLPAVTTNPSSVMGHMVIRMLGQSTDPGTIGLANIWCTNPTMVLFANWQLAMNRPAATREIDFVDVMSHEIGHMLGFRHSNDSPGACGGVSYSGRAMMHPSAGQARSLFRDDWDGMRAGSGSCRYFPRLPTGTLIVRRSQDGGATWFLDHWLTEGSNNGPGIAAGNFGGGPFLLEARIDSDNYLSVMRRDATCPGGWCGPYFDPTSPRPRAFAGVSVACSPSRCIVVYPLFENTTTPTQEGILRMLTTTNGSTFTVFDTPYRTMARPGIAYSATRGRFYVAYANLPNPDDGSLGQLYVFSTTNGSSVSSAFEVQTSAEEDFAAAGPGIACPSSKCWVLFPESRVLTPTLRQVVFNTDSAGAITGLTSSFSYPFWGFSGSRTVASRHDVGVAYDTTRTDLVFAFREQNAAQSLLAVWQGDPDTFPPQGWDGVPWAGFNSGGEVQQGNLFGPAVTVDTSTEPDTVYVIGHAP